MLKALHKSVQLRKRHIHKFSPVLIIMADEAKAAGLGERIDMRPRAEREKKKKKGPSKEGVFEIDLPVLIFFLFLAMMEELKAVKVCVVEFVVKRVNKFKFAFSLLVSGRSARTNRTVSSQNSNGCCNSVGRASSRTH